MKKIAVLLILLTLAFPLSGCLESGQESLSPDEHVVQPGEEDVHEPQDEARDEEAVGADYQVVLYFSDDQAEKLVPELRSLSVKATPREAIEALIDGPQNEGRLKTIPSGTELLAISVDNGTATVDFSAEFAGNHPGGSAAEIMTVYSVTNTLTEFEDIEEVIFKVAGGRVDTLTGHMDLTRPVQRDESLIGD